MSTLQNKIDFAVVFSVNKATLTETRSTGTDRE